MSRHSSTKMCVWDLIGDANLSAALSQSLDWKLQAVVLWLSFMDGLGAC